MVDPLIEKLLVLQERDIRRDGVRRDLDDIPLRRTALEREVAVAKAAHQETLEKQKTFEMKRRDMERQTADAEAQRFKLRSQQASCRKNDEYAMLDKQIDAATAKIGELETETFSAMMSLDEFGPAVKKSREEADRRAAEVQVKIDALMREAAKLEEALKGADAELADAKAKVPQDAVDLFVYVKSRVKHPPFIVPMEEMRCMGCHLKVSSDVWNLAKVAGNLTRCDGCGRIVYLER